MFDVTDTTIPCSGNVMKEATIPPSDSPSWPRFILRVANSALGNRPTAPYTPRTDPLASRRKVSFCLRDSERQAGAVDRQRGHQHQVGALGLQHRLEALHYPRRLLRVRA